METGRKQVTDETVYAGPVTGAPSAQCWNCAPADIPDPLMRRLFLYWQSKRGGKRFPGRRDIDPLEMCFVLGNLVLVDVHYPGPRFRYRLIGTNLLLRDGRDRTGQWIDELPSLEYRRLVLARLQSLIDRPEPLFLRNVSVLDNRTYDYEALWLPLASDGENIDMLLACQFHKARPVR